MSRKEIIMFSATIIISTLLSTIFNTVLLKSDTNHRIYEYYQTVNAAEVSPHVLKERVSRGEKVIIVDVRDPGAYDSSHIYWAINISADDPELVEKFRALGSDNAIVTYCYTQDCMASRQVGKILSENGIYVQHLNVWYIEREKKEWTWDVFRTDWSCPLTWAAWC